MDENTRQMMEQLKSNPAALRKLMQSRDGQTLMQALTRPDNGAGLQRAMQAAMRRPAGAHQQQCKQVNREEVRPHGGV